MTALGPVAQDQSSLLLAEGTRLVHIGAHKTGTTALQAAMWGARDAMHDQGVRYAGRYRNPASAVRAVTGQESLYSDKPPPMREWRSLVHEIANAREPRLVVSSEYFAYADAAAIRRIAADLDASRLHIVVTLRPLARVIPSMWQQSVQGGQRMPLERWLHHLFPEPPATSSAPFWNLGRHDELITRWAEVVGVDRVTAVVVDPRDHTFSLRVFERMLGLREGTLELVHDRTNRSLTLSEAESVRAFNIRFKQAGLSRALHARVMRFGAAQHLKLREPGDDEAGIHLPAWSLERVAQVSAKVTDRIAASGVRVVGDLSDLTVPDLGPARASPDPGAAHTGASEPVQASPAIAASLAMGVLIASGATRHRAGAGGKLEADASSIPSWLMLGTIGNRMLAAGLALVKDVRGRLHRAGVRRSSDLRSRDSVHAGGGARYGRARPRDITGQRRMEPQRRPRPAPAARGDLAPPHRTPEDRHDRAPGRISRGTLRRGAQGVHTPAAVATRSPRSRRSSASRGSTGRGPPADLELAQARQRDAALGCRAGRPQQRVLRRRAARDDPDRRGRPGRRSWVHVVVTLRPLARILTSQWQQYVQSNLRISFDDWLDAMFNKEPGRITPVLLVPPSPRSTDRALGGCRGLRPDDGRRPRRERPRLRPARV